MTATGSDRTLRLFKVDGHDNAKLQSMFLDRFPIQYAEFSADGRQIIVTAGQRHYFTYDLDTGRVDPVFPNKGRNSLYSKFAVAPSNEYLAFSFNDGALMLSSARTKQWIADMKMNGPVYGTAFEHRQPHSLLSFGNGNEICRWDLRMFRCVHRFLDEGCTKGTALAISPFDDYIACGYAC